MDSVAPPVPATSAGQHRGWLKAELRQALRSAPRALAASVISLPLWAGIAGAFTASAAAGWFLKNYCGLASSALPYFQILASIGINVALLAAWLALSPLQCRAWSWSQAWLRGALLCSGAFAGLYFCGDESIQTFIALWLLTLAQGAALLSLCAVLTLVLDGNASGARQIMALLLAAAVTALFWTRTPIQSAPRDTERPDGKSGGVALSDLYYDAVLKFSPPLAISTAWYMESDVSRRKASASRFDLIHGPRTYEIWMGSYTVLPYPPVYPRFDLETRRLRPGLVLALFAWGLPLLLCADLLLLVQARRRRARAA